MNRDNVVWETNIPPHFSTKGGRARRSCWPPTTFYFFSLWEKQKIVYQFRSNQREKFQKWLDIASSNIWQSLSVFWLIINFCGKIISAPQSQSEVDVKMNFPARIFILRAFSHLGFLPKSLINGTGTASEFLFIRKRLIKKGNWNIYRELTGFENHLNTHIWANFLNVRSKQDRGL